MIHRFLHLVDLVDIELSAVLAARQLAKFLGFASPVGWALLLFVSPRPSDCCTHFFFLMLFLTCLYQTPPKPLHFSFLLNVFSISHPGPQLLTLLEWHAVNMTVGRTQACQVCYTLPLWLGECSDFS